MKLSKEDKNELIRKMLEICPNSSRKQLSGYIYISETKEEAIQKTIEWKKYVEKSIKAIEKSNKQHIKNEEKQEKLNMLRMIPEYIEERDTEGMFQSSIAFLNGRLRSYNAAIEELKEQRDLMYSKTSITKNNNKIFVIQKKINTIEFILKLVKEEHT